MLYYLCLPYPTKIGLGKVSRRFDPVQLVARDPVELRPHAKFTTPDQASLK